jgi:SAM-dependent methyltransferase
VRSARLHEIVRVIEIKRLTGASGPKGRRSSLVNLDFWARGDYVDDYSGGGLRPPETALLALERAALAGRVLELGCGAGRVTGHLIELAGSVDAVDISPIMIAHCRREHPGASYRVCDLRDLSCYEDGSFEAVVAPYCVLDVFDDAERRQVLDEIARVLVPRGLLIASTHNLGYAPRIASPRRVLARSPRDVARNLLHLPRRVRNSRSLRALQRVESDHAILLDEGHDYSLLHYYISRDAQERQFLEHGFELRECLDLEGEPVGPGDDRPGAPELHYSARRVA